MHVLFITSWWPTKENPINGVFIQEHAIAISKYTNISVIYLNSVEKSTSWKDFPSTYTKEITEINEKMNVIKIDLKLRVRRFGFFEKQLNKIIKDSIQEYEQRDPIKIIHLNVLNSLWPWHLFKHCEKLKKPLILSEHSSFYHTEIYQLPAMQVEKRKKEITKQLNKPALKYILPVSRQLGNLISENFLVPAKKMVVIPNVANDVFLSLPVSKRMNTAEILIFAAAMWCPPKNPLLFFKLLRLLKDREQTKYHSLKINWAGAGEQLEDIKTFVKNELPDLKIQFPGLLTKIEIAAYMNQADLLVHPSDAENLPCIIIESICAGLPVLSAKINGIVELLTNENGRMYTAQDLESFYQTFIDMIDNLDQFNKEKIASEARKKYNATAIGKQIHDVYKKALAE